MARSLGLSRALTLGTDPKQVPVGYGCNELGLLEPGTVRGGGPGAEGPA